MRHNEAVELSRRKFIEACTPVIEAIHELMWAAQDILEGGSSHAGSVMLQRRCPVFVMM